MADTQMADDDLAKANALCEMLKTHNGGDVTLIDLRGLTMWTDFFIVATITSGAHLGALSRYIKEFAAEKKISVLRKQRRGETGGEWNVTDLGGMVIHLMSEGARKFYELELLWDQGVVHKI
ncbi:ribosomal silencing factor RsfS [Spirochaetia bacterium]|nr:ribosomal silencing factor RsfS [Spirochaetia bacterium]GHV21654.1 ribosomal silencing factor RsfS [Spirochaetia bacterium]